MNSRQIFGLLKRRWTYDGAPSFAVKEGVFVRQVKPETETQAVVTEALGRRLPRLGAPEGAEQRFLVSRHHLQVLLFPGEGVRQVLDVLWLVFLHVRVQRLQDLTDQGADLLGDAARLLDFINL